MVNKISNNTKQELLNALISRYLQSKKKEKTLIVNEFTSLTGYHRKHVIRLLKKRNHSGEIKVKKINYNRIYNEAVKEALIIIWEAADRICSKRLKVALPFYIEALERHNHLKLNDDVKKLLLKISPSTIDRLLYGIRKTNKTKKYRNQPKKVSKKIQVRTFSDWDEPEVGYMEIDFVVHSGGSMSGNLIHTFVATDICSGWTEFIPLLAREQSLVVEGIDIFRNQLPFDLIGIDSDNDSAFINDSLFNYCEENNLKFTRSRPYRKNDQAWVEQKNGSIIRKFVGYDRFTGIVAGQALANLYYYLRLYINFLQPSFKIREKKRVGAKVKKIYFKPATPVERLLNNPGIKTSIKKRLKMKQQELDPINILHKIRDQQAALSALASPNDPQDIHGKTSLEDFLSKLPQLWKSGNPNPIHKKRNDRKRNWRTRQDPFKEVWPTVLIWLQEEPDSTAKELFKRLHKNNPKQFYDGQLRTLQRRIKEWRKIMAKKLVYCFSQENIESTIAKPIRLNK